MTSPEPNAQDNVLRPNQFLEERERLWEIFAELDQPLHDMLDQVNRNVSSFDPAKFMETKQRFDDLLKHYHKHVPWLTTEMLSPNDPSSPSAAGEPGTPTT